ncbi:hypothetical protein AB0I94_35950 [Streptomyces sp. NPDC050147]|uniref:hypothetical protein n=1 Tax=Streptomyces sp. NPDC050147 TaxID=3155513 RepID=UPI003415FE58
MDQQETIKLFLARSKRKNETVPIRHSFVQRGSRGATKPGPLSQLVRRNQSRALDLYLLLSAVTGAGDYSATDWAGNWARSLGLYDEKSGATAVSRAWKTLKDLNLVASARGEEGKAKITKLLEDGSGAPYRPPATGDFYFQLPFWYWRDQLNEKLTPPGKAMLLIALDLRNDEFALVQDRIGEWYGLAPESVRKGVDELIHNQVLLRPRYEWFSTLRSRTGKAARPLYQFALEYTPPGLKNHASALSAE